MNRKLLWSLILFFLLADLVYSFKQHLSQPLDGDMAWNIVPDDAVKPILEDPLGTKVLFDHRSYPNPNRFFSHYFIITYYEYVPIILQNFVTPVDSVYLAGAFVKIITQVILIFLLAVMMTGTFNVLRLEFIIAAAIVTPFFQTEGYQSYMGIIDRAPTYVFFYALPFALLLIYFLPLVLQYFHGRKPGCQILVYLLWIPFALVISLSGPLNTGIALITSLLLFFWIIRRNYYSTTSHGFFQKLKEAVAAIPLNLWFYLIPVCIFSIYSLFLGLNNSNNTSIPLWEMYSRLPVGIYNPITKKLGFPILLISIAMNSYLINRNYRTEAGEKILGIIKWAGLFILLYILLLPLGGFREYRPNVIRYDTILPVTVCLAFIFGITTLFLFNNITSMQKRWYVPVICAILLFFTINDEPHFDKNICEKNALKIIAESRQDTVQLHCDCTIIAWQQKLNVGDSWQSRQLLTKWRITLHDKPFSNE